MITTAIINWKGGVAKTITSGNLAYNLAAVHNKRVLLIDNDPQGDASKLFSLHGYDRRGTTELLKDKEINIRDVIQKTDHENLDIITANMQLNPACIQVNMDMMRPQQTIYKEHLANVADEYDYCIIDNAPSANINVTNALVAANNAIVPIKVDKFSFDGMKELTKSFDDIKKYLNHDLIFLGCLITMAANNKLNREGGEWLRGADGYPLFRTAIRRTVKVDESTFQGPLICSDKSCTACQDYLEFAKEYLELLEG